MCQGTSQLHDIRLEETSVLPSFSLNITVEVSHQKEDICVYLYLLQPMKTRIFKEIERTTKIDV